MFVFTLLISLAVIKAAWWPSCSPRSEEVRFDCYPEANKTQDKCMQRKCCWSNPLAGGFNRGPSCYFPPNYPGFRILSSTVSPDRTTYVLKRDENTEFIYLPINELKLEVISMGPNTVRIKITDMNDPNRFEVPFVLQSTDTYSRPVSFEHEITGGTVDGSPFGIKVSRKFGNKQTIFDSSIAPLIYSNQFIQFSTKLPSQHVYGLGEHRTQFQISANWRKLAFWTRDQATVRDDNLYGNHPFLMSFDKNKEAFGYFMLNSNAMETKFTPMPAVTYRTIGGIVDLFVYMGPSAEEVIEQYWATVGYPLMAPYWSLGYHLSRWNYGTLDKLQVIVNKMKELDFPYDVQWTDIDALVGKRIFTYDQVGWKGLPEFVAQLHRESKKYISINDPGIACDPKITDYETYKRGIAADVYVKWANGSGYLVGEVWPGLTVYPDWTHPNAQKWWSDELVIWNRTIPVDGLWIDMNEVSSFIYGSVDGCDTKLDNPDFVPEILEGKLWAKTICVSATQTVSNQYNMHSLYGHTWSIITNQGIQAVHPQKRPFIITRASFSGSAKYTSKWGGDNFATFNDMYYSITDILNFNIFGFSQTGDDLCGFIFDTTDELCTRWHQVGFLYTFMRNHNNDASIPHDPTVFSPYIRNIMKQTVIMRYRLLPYMYTLLYRGSAFAKLTFRPLMFEYPKDIQTHSIDTQFFFGEALMSAPVLHNLATQVDVYFPWSPRQKWFEFPSGKPVNTPNYGVWKLLDAPLNKTWMFIRSGHVVPTHIITNESLNAVQNRNSGFRIYAALGDGKDDVIKGNLFWDDGESLLELNRFTYISIQGNDGLLSFQTINSNYTASNLMVNEVIVFGVHKAIKSVMIDNANYDNYVFDSGMDQLIIKKLKLNIGKKEIHTISWKY